MKVLWITNTLFPDVCIELGISTPIVGGWMYSGAKALIKENKCIQLAVATLYNGKELKSIYLNGITYFLVPNKGKNKKYNFNLEIHWKSIKNKFCPDVVHIHGTEYPHGLAYIQACGNKQVIVSIQGLVSVYERYYYGGISEKSLFKNITLRDIVRNDTIFQQHYNMYQRGLIEKKIINSVEHVIGRTSWDKAHIWAINPSAQYHFCNETLRDAFYKNKWEFDKCEKQSIFLSQAYYPLKGLQQMIQALPLILRYYPDTKVYVAGNDFITNRSWRLNGFGKYIRSLIEKNCLTNKIIFFGILSEKEMCNRYLKSHVFVCPSAIENSPNSVGEAQLLGVPCISSNVGGVSDMITDNISGLLYRFEEIEMLAASICRIFSNTFLANKLSECENGIASLRHNKQLNAQKLGVIYGTIYDSKTL